MDFIHWIWDRRKDKDKWTTNDKMIDQVGECDYLGELHRLLYETDNS